MSGPDWVLVALALGALAGLAALLATMPSGGEGDPLQHQQVERAEVVRAE